MRPGLTSFRRKKDNIKLVMNSNFWNDVDLRESMLLFLVIAMVAIAQFSQNTDSCGTQMTYSIKLLYIMNNPLAGS